MRRRSFCRALGALPVAASLPVVGQPAPPLRLAWVSIERLGTPSPSLEALRVGMREVGYAEGADYTIATWWGEGSAQNLERMAPEIVRSQPDVIVSQGGLALIPLVRAGVKIPIVFTYSGDPVEAKLAASFNRPGGTMTGISYFTLEIVGKRLELLREIVPGVKRVAFLANPQHPGEQKELTAAQAAAAKLGMSVRYFPFRSETELDNALADIARGRDDAIVAFADAFTMSYAERIAAFSIRERIPAVDGWAQFARRGNLMTYGPVLEDCYRRLAAYIDKIRRGAKPGDLPIELPTKLEFVINARTAKALGLKLSPGIVSRADEVIQ